MIAIAVAALAAASPAYHTYPQTITVDATAADTGDVKVILCRSTAAFARKTVVRRGTAATALRPLPQPYTDCDSALWKVSGQVDHKGAFDGTFLSQSSGTVVTVSGYIDSNGRIKSAKVGVQAFQAPPAPRCHTLMPARRVKSGSRDNCTTVNKTRIVHMGIALGHAAIARFDTEEHAEAHIDKVVRAVSELILEPQLGVRLQIDELRFATDEAWASCARGIDYQLEAFSQDSMPPNSNLLWHLIDSCFHLEGVAFIGHFCNNGKFIYESPFGNIDIYMHADRGVTHMSSVLDVSTTANDGTWQTLAHELGHVLGAEHPFEGKGVSHHGKVGGIMDYLCDTAACQNNPFAQDLRLGNEWKFHTDNVERVCQTLEWAETFDCPYMDVKVARAETEAATVKNSDAPRELATNAMTQVHHHTIHYVSSLRHRGQNDNLVTGLSALTVVALIFIVGGLFLCKS